MNYTSLEVAISQIKSEQNVFVQGSASTPITLINELIRQKERLTNCKIICMSVKDVDLNSVELKGHFYINALFVSDANREAVNSDRGDYIPIFLSEAPSLFRKNILPLDVALIQISPPDENGFCSLGTSVDVTLAAIESAKMIIASVNKNMPRTEGDSIIRVSKIHYLVESHHELPEVNYGHKASDSILKISETIATMIEDGSTLQMGIGAIPDLVLQKLIHHRNLGIHSEMISDGVISLIENGIINNSKKKIHPGKSVVGFALGTKKLYNFLHNRKDILMMDMAFVNNPFVIGQNPKVVAINSAIEIDLTGQVCADSIGKIQYSGIGGQLDFIHGASLSEGGIPIIALTSTTNKGQSRIVAQLKTGAGVVTTRGNSHWIVTEYGAVNLFGKNMEERAELLVSISHPSHREELQKEFEIRFK